MHDIDKGVIFVQEVSTGSFAEAVRRLGKPTNSMSRYIDKLEKGQNTR